ncbi:hypothetical protein [Kordia jejudonensis]|uniref:hypothetical protein n=1 Tax=Kordia jejudonensis TaxID=1348245 RepID=UPI00062907B0|nr:hypothetical protein [Kordia jejudonensis]
MKGNETLAGYDMALALSENTINYQFKELHTRSIIHKKWGILAGTQKVNDVKKDFHITDQDANFNTKLERWIDLQQQISNAREHNEWSEIGKLVATLAEENLNFDFGWNANLNAPKINIIQNDSKNLTLQIRFKSGKLYYRPDETGVVEHYNLKGAVYAFTVPIGQLSVDKDNMILDAGAEVKKIIKNSGLSDQDFTIESLFLNFQNANIATYNQQKSNLPEGAVVAFKVAIENYFNVILQGEENSYVLGYSLQRKRIKPSEHAMFQPTSLNFSTSYSKQKDEKKRGQFSALNFLMMLNDTKPPTNTTAGILPKSLIELGKDTTSTTDGVFSIQHKHFKIYLKSLDDYVETTFKNLDGVTLRHGFIDGKMILDKHEKKNDDTIDITYTVTKEDVKNNSDQSGISVRYKIEIKVKVIVKAWFIEVGEKTLSTSGKYTKDEIKNAGEPGYLDFTIKTGESGRFNLDHNLTEPKVAFDENPNLFGNGFWNDLLSIITFVVSWVFLIVKAIVTQISADLGKKGASSSNALIKKLNHISVLNQTNKVILPLGNVYTFKNLHILEEEDIVAYDISYATKTEKQNELS